MTQTQLEREVSRATNESVRTIRRHGFSMLPLPNHPCDDEPEIDCIQIIDWDRQDALNRRAA